MMHRADSTPWCVYSYCCIIKLPLSNMKRRHGQKISVAVICERLPSTADIAAKYKDDLPTPCLFAEEMHRWQHRYQGKDPQECPDSCAKAIKVCEKDTFPNLHVLLGLWLACTIPHTTCECKRSASALMRLHTYMRASMGQSRISSLALIYIHYDIAVDLDKTVDLFSQMYPMKLELKNLLYN